MKVKVRVKPASKVAKVVEEEGTLVVFLKSPPVEGRANRELVEVLAKHFGVTKDSVRILRGKKSRTKVIEIVNR
ncbi:MAG: DUF167 domain-containing protein [Thermotogae bacterium]|nr:DUF167 domain-containing protein [Thermotogota bacterium]